VKNLLIRILVACIAVPAIIFISLYGRIPFLIFIEIITLVGLWEFAELVKKKNGATSTWLFILGGVFFPICSYFFSSPLIYLPFFLLFFSFAQIIKGKIEGAFFRVSSFFFGEIYIGLFFSFLILIRELPFKIGLEYKIGGHWIIYILLTIWTCDTLAYFIGAPLGKHKLAPTISPKKSIEGGIGGILGAFLCAVVSKYLFFPDFQGKDLFFIALIVGVVGQSADLLESLLKRDVGVKDSSTIIPGHGGILDRFDSLLLVAPVVYVYLRLVVYP
jgi:phosphatidate cytidylyltransferase